MSRRGGGEEGGKATGRRPLEREGWRKGVPSGWEEGGWSATGRLKKMESSSWSSSMPKGSRSTASGNLLPGGSWRMGCGGRNGIDVEEEVVEEVEEDNGNREIGGGR